MLTHTWNMINTLTISNNFEFKYLKKNNQNEQNFERDLKVQNCTEFVFSVRV